MTARVINDPSALGWELDATTGRWEWKAECDCPDVGGGGGGWGTSGLPSAVRPWGNSDEVPEMATSYVGDTPLCWDDDVYVIWNDAADRNLVHWCRFTVDESGAFTKHELGSTATSMDNREINPTSSVVGSNNPWFVRAGDYLFKPSGKSTRTGLYAKRNADKTLSFGYLHDDLNWSSWYGVTPEWLALCTTSDGGLLAGVAGSGGSVSGRWGAFAKIGVDGSGNLTLLVNSPEMAGHSSGGALMRMDLMETPYGYLYSHAHNANGGHYLYFATYDDSFTRISRINNYQYIPKSGSTSTVRMSARDPSGLGFFLIMSSSDTDGVSSIAGPVINEDGTIPSQPRETSNSFQRYRMQMGNSSQPAPISNSGGGLGNGLGNSTCGYFGNGDANGSGPFEINSLGTYYVGVPADITVQTSQVTGSRRWFNWQVNTQDWAAAFNNFSERRRAVPSGVDGVFVLSSSDKKLQAYRAGVANPFRSYIQVVNGKVSSEEVFTDQPDPDYLPVIYGAGEFESDARGVEEVSYTVDLHNGVVIKNGGDEFDNNQEQSE